MIEAKGPFIVTNEVYRSVEVAHHWRDRMRRVCSTRGTPAPNQELIGVGIISGGYDVEHGGMLRVCCHSKLLGRISLEEEVIVATGDKERTICVCVRMCICMCVKNAA